MDPKFPDCMGTNPLMLEDPVFYVVVVVWLMASEDITSVIMFSFWTGRALLVGVTNKVCTYLLLLRSEFCSKTALLCYAPMLLTPWIMLLRIVIMLTSCSPYIIHGQVALAVNMETVVRAWMIEHGLLSMVRACSPFEQTLSLLSLIGLATMNAAV